MENKSTNKAATGGSVGVCGLLQVAFIVLKLCKVIDWKWVWVLSPLWIIPSAAFVLIMIVVIATLIGECKKKK